MKKIFVRLHPKNKLHTKTKIFYFLDKSTIVAISFLFSKLTSALLKKMEKSLKLCNKYFSKWKIKINHEKTQSIIFPYNKSYKRLPLRHLQFENNNIVIQNHVKYLGVILDKKLSFQKHIDETCVKAMKSLRALWTLLHRRSFLNFKNKNLIFKCVLRPILSYASPVWYKAANSHLKKMQIIQNKCLKIINNQPWRYSTRLLHLETGYEKFTDFIMRQNLNYFNKITNSSYDIIRECREIS